jgi:hypothetical protein
MLIICPGLMYGEVFSIRAPCHGTVAVRVWWLSAKER